MNPVMKVLGGVVLIAAWGPCLLAADFNVRDHGGKIQAAVEAAAAAGGGRVVVPAGEWTSGTIWLKSHTELHLEKGAVIKGSTDAKDYNRNDVFPENFWSAGEEWSGGHLVMAYQAEDVAITGEGVIDGNGPAFFGECDEDSRFPGYKYGLKLLPLDREWYRPGPMVAIFLSKNIRLAGVTLKNTPCWTAHFRCCDGLDIRGVTIDADRTIANSDGFSIDCTRNVTVKDCTVKCGDDGFAIRASCGHHAAERPCENIRIENCDVWTCCFGIRFGVGTGTIRDVDVKNCRFHEAAPGIGFTPSWVNAKKNVFIENIRIHDCTITECEYPVAVWMPNAGESSVKDLLFENCRFESLLPSQICGNEQAQAENILFKNCTRRHLEKWKVRYNLGWGRRCGKRSRKFMEIWGPAKKVLAENCTPSDEIKGALVLSFDDRNFEDWEKAEPIFAKYGAHATFFVSGPIDNEAVKAMKFLSERGHSVGLHGLRHANADREIETKGAEKYYTEDIAPQADNCGVCYVPVHSFAYPNCRRTDAADQLFYKNGFDRVRGGVKGATPYDPKGEKRSERKPLVTNDDIFFPAAELSRRRRLDTIIMGEAYHTDIEDILACIRRAAERKEVFVVTSHGIAPDAKDIHMKTEWLEKMLAAAKAHGLPVLGFDELPSCK